MSDPDTIREAPPSGNANRDAVWMALNTLRAVNAEEEALRDKAMVALDRIAAVEAQRDELTRALRRAQILAARGWEVDTGTDFDLWLAVVMDDEQLAKWIERPVDDIRAALASAGADKPPQEQAE